MINEINDQKTQLLGYSLSPRQDAVVNYLLPSVAACVLYKFIIAVDIAVIFRHFKDGDPIWASFTLFIMFLPALGSYMIIISDWDYWPEPENGLTNENVGWCVKKTLVHLFFPIWNIWRFAEKIFWSIEALISENEENFCNAVAMIKEPRLIELYVFLQAYLHALPQVLLQLHIIMRHTSAIAKETKDIQVTCILFNLAKVAITTTYYQRFKAQKLTGSQYPWLKSKKILRSSIGYNSNNSVVLRNPQSNPPRAVVEDTREGLNDISRLYNIEPSVLMERRRSSDIYLEPELIQEESNLMPNTTEQNLGSQEASTPKKRISFSSLTEKFTNRTTATSNQSSNVNFNIKRITYEKGLQEDSIPGKMIAFLWWFTFLLGRVLAVSAFAYFFPEACVWLLISHFILVTVVLSYDVKSNNVKKDKIIFFIFLGLVYIFCIIEFKIRFKKTYFIYVGYFGVMYLENFTMCLVWYLGELESLENDYWYKFIFFITVMSSVLSVSSMIFYLILVKPKSVLLPAK